MADMHRPGRIGGDIFDVDRHIAADIARAEIPAGPNGVTQRVEPCRRLEREIDEARPGDLDFCDQVVGAKPSGIGVGEFARFFPGVLGKHHGDVGRHIAVGLIPGRLDGHARQIDICRQIARHDQFVAHAANTIEHFGKNVMRDHRNPCFALHIRAPRA